MEADDSSETTKIPENVDISSISDETIKLFGLDQDRINKLKEAHSSAILQKRGEEFYRQIKQGTPPEDFTLEIGDSLKFQIPSGTTPEKLPKIIMGNFRRYTITPDTTRELQKLNSWLSGYMETAFTEKDWETVLPTADSMGQGVEILQKLRAIVPQDFNESLRIAQAYENYKKQKELEKNQTTVAPAIPPTPTLGTTPESKPPLRPVPPSEPPGP